MDRDYLSPISTEPTENYYAVLNRSDQDGMIDWDGQVFTQTNAGIPWVWGEMLFFAFWHLALSGGVFPYEQKHSFIR